MIRRVFADAALLLLAAAVPAAGQTTLSSLQQAVACAVPPMVGPPPNAPAHVVGSQDPVSRTVFGPGDLLVVETLPDALALGQVYFVRRPLTFGREDIAPADRAIKTAGWIRIVALDGTIAVADVVQVCDTISVGDYLDPFLPPEVSADLLTVNRAGELDFDASAHVLVGDDERRAAGVGDFMLLDRGAPQGVIIGTRFAVYRDKRLPGLPLAPVAEAVAVASGPTRSVVRILEARDVVMTGDLAVPRR